MKNIKQYLKYYFLEDYLFGEVNKNFRKRGYLTPEEFFAIVIWKRNPSKTNILNGIKEDGRTIREITSRIAAAKTEEQKLNALLSPKISGIGMAFASAILTVCYPDDFTVVDYRAIASLEYLGEKITGNPRTTVADYFDYIDTCKRLAQKYGLSLRDFDRGLWGRDFYEGTNGLKHIIGGLN